MNFWFSKPHDVPLRHTLELAMKGRYALDCGSAGWRVAAVCEALCRIHDDLLALAARCSNAPLRPAAHNRAQPHSDARAGHVLAKGRRGEQENFEMLATLSDSTWSLTLHHVEGISRRESRSSISSS
jgi:hypothetical protein